MEKKRKLSSKIIVKLTAVITAIAMVVTLVPANLWQVEATTTLNNPTIKNNEGGEPTITYDCIYFGRYKQNFNCVGGEAGGFKTEPIKWRVLAVNGDDAFLLADKILDSKKYNEVRTAITWEKSTVRSWLNGYDSTANEYGADYTDENFIDSAFTEEEQRAIKTTLVENKDNPEDGTDGGNDTNDKVYFLSTEEIANQAYGFNGDFDDYYDKAKRAKTTEYAKYLGAQTNTGDEIYYGVAIYGNGQWWLRSPGYLPDNVYHVNPIGRVYDYAVGTMVNDSRTAVRPVLHLNLSSDVWSYAGTVSSDDAYEQIENPHDWNDWKANNDGKTHSRDCKYSCGTIESAEHLFSGWVVTKEPAVGEEGSRERSCTICQYSESETLSALKQEIAELIGLSGTIKGHKVSYDSISVWLEGEDGVIYPADVSNGTVQNGEISYEYTVSAPAGRYTLMVEATSEGVTVNRNKSVELKDENETKDVNLPSGQVKSKVDKEESKTSVIVDGMDALADQEAQQDGIVEITFAIADTDSDNPDKEKIKKNAPKGHKLDFMDFTIHKTVYYETGSTDKEQITDTGNHMMEIIVPFDNNGKKDIKVYRHHEDNVDILSETKNSDGEWIEILDGYIVIHAKKFSVYAVGYEEEGTDIGGGSLTPYPTPDDSDSKEPESPEEDDSVKDDENDNESGKPADLKNKTVKQEGGIVLKVNTKKNGTATITGIVKNNKKVIAIKDTATVNGVKYRVTAIDGKTFKNCKKVTKIIVPASVKLIKKNAFWGAKRLKHIVFKSKNAGTIRNGAFKGLTTKKITVTLNKKMTRKEFVKASNMLKKAGFEGKIRKTGK